MIEIFISPAEDVHKRLENALGERLGESFVIEKTANGKPFISGNPIYFSLSHSKDSAAFVLSQKPVGIDIETPRGKLRESVLKRFTAREQSEINSEREFLKHWTAREAFIKLNDLKLMETLKRIEFFGGKIYLDGAEQPVNINSYRLGETIITVCGE